MFPQRNMIRLSQRAGQQLRSAPVRSAVQRRFNSTETKPSWLADNEFNRERAAVKEHAAGTSGTYFLDYLVILYWLETCRSPMLTQWPLDLWRKLSI
jgi:hypothetical protein